MFNIYHRMQAKVVADHIFPKFTRRGNRKAPKKALKQETAREISEQQQLFRSGQDSLVHSPVDTVSQADPYSPLETAYSPVSELDLDGSAETIDALYPDHLQTTTKEGEWHSSGVNPSTGTPAGRPVVSTEDTSPRIIGSTDDNFEGAIATENSNPRNKGAEYAHPPGGESLEFEDADGEPFDSSAAQSHELEDAEPESSRTQEYLAQDAGHVEYDDSDAPPGDDQDIPAEQAGADATEYFSFSEIQVDPEAPEDYTFGPCRLQLAHDGMKESVAVLLTWDLSQKIKEAAMQQRRYDQEAEFSKAQLREIKTFIRKVQREIRSHELKIGRRQSSSIGAGDEAAEREPTAAEKELEALKGMLQDNELKKTEIENALELLGDFLRQAQAEVMASFDEAFVHALLLPGNEAVKKPVETFDLQEDYKKYQAKFADPREDEADIVIPELDTNKDHLYNNYVPSPEEQRDMDLRRALHEARERYAEADFAFDMRVETQRREAELNRQAWLSGDDPLDATQEEFDQRWFVRAQELTRELSAAENALEEIMIACAEARIELNDVSQLDHWAQYSNDGDVGSEIDWTEEDFALRTLYCKEDEVINGWLDAVPDVLEGEIDSLPDVELERWSCKEHSNEDSWSSHAIARDRRVIDKSEAYRLALVEGARREYEKRQPVCQDERSRRISIELLAGGARKKTDIQTSNARRSSCL